MGEKGAEGDVGGMVPAIGEEGRGIVPRNRHARLAKLRTGVRGDFVKEMSRRLKSLHFPEARHAVQSMVRQQQTSQHSNCSVAPSPPL